MRPSLLALVILAATGACTRQPAVLVPVAIDGPPEAVVVQTGAVETPVALTEAEVLRERLIVPVSDARILDSFDHGRDGGARRHNAIDLMAPRGTPIVSADEGRVLRMSSNTLGGITLYAADPMDRFVYYYAHMDAYHPSMHPGRVLARGDTIGFVGATGNASASAPHLHFQIMRMPADGKYWIGEPINPFPILRADGPSPSADGSAGRPRPEREPWD